MKKKKTISKKFLIDIANDGGFFYIRKHKNLNEPFLFRFVGTYSAYLIRKKKKTMSFKDESCSLTIES